MFEFAWKFTLPHEGGLCDDAGDPGGITKYGVDIRMLSGMTSTSDKKALSDLGIKLPVSRQTIKDLTQAQAAGVYRYCVWERMGLDRFPDVVSCPMFDCGVHNGVSRATRFAQAAHNAVRPSTPLTVDGSLGPKTAAALIEDCVRRERAIILAWEMVKARAEFLANLKGMDKFQKGFKARMKDLRDYLNF